MKRRGGDWRPFLFFVRMSFDELFGSVLIKTLRVFVEERP
jgi:hypothetical protein